MKYDLVKRILSKRHSDDVTQLVSEYINEYNLHHNLLLDYEDLQEQVRVLEAENKILKEEANKHDY